MRSVCTLCLFSLCVFHFYQALRRGWVELTRKSDRWSILRKPRRKQQLAKRMVSRPVIDPVLLLLEWGEYTLPLIVVRRMASQQSSEDRLVIAEAKDDEEDEVEDTTDAEQSLRS